MKSLSIQDVLDMHPCGWDDAHNGKNYTPERLAELFNGRERVTLFEIAEADVSIEHRLWVLLRPELMGEWEFRSCCADIAKSVEHIYNVPNDTRVSDCIKGIYDFADGKISEEDLNAVGTAAGDAVGDVGGTGDVGDTGDAWAARAAGDASWAAAHTTDAAAADLAPAHFTHAAAADLAPAHFTHAAARAADHFTDATARAAGAAEREMQLDFVLNYIFSEAGKRGRTSMIKDALEMILAYILTFVVVAGLFALII